MNFENTIVIQRPIREVFAFVAEFENIPKWNYYVKRVSKLSDGPSGEGTVYHQVQKSDQQYFQITVYCPSEMIEVETTQDSKPGFVRRFVFEALPDSTRIVDTWQLKLGRNPLIQWLLISRMKSAVKENLGKLKELLETDQTQLQDGRVVSA